MRRQRTRLTLEQRQQWEEVLQRCRDRGDREHRDGRDRQSGSGHVETALSAQVIEETGSGSNILRALDAEVVRCAGRYMERAMPYAQT